MSRSLVKKLASEARKVEKAEEAVAAAEAIAQAAAEAAKKDEVEKIVVSLKAGRQHGHNWQVRRTWRQSVRLTGF